jgi:hypothetical protein
VPVAPAKRWLRRFAPAALLLVYFVAATTAWSGKCVTFDETFHIVSGYSYWLFGDFRLHPSNGNLPQRWAALPLLWLKPEFPSRDQANWRHADKWRLGQQLLYSSSVSAERQVSAGRAMIVLVSLAMGLLIFHWTEQLWGRGGAWLALLLFTFCPTMLSHGTLITSDAMAAFFFLAVQCALWTWLQRVTWPRVLVSSLLMAGLMLSKFSAPLIIPMALVLVVLRVAAGEPLPVELGEPLIVSNRLRRLVVIVAVMFVHVFVAWALIWAAYNFRFAMLVDAQPDRDSPEEPWSQLLDQRQPSSCVIAFCSNLQLLPEAYLYGYLHTLRHGQIRASFLNGEYDIKGRPLYFPYCLAVKTPLELFVLLGLASAALIKIVLAEPDRRQRLARVGSMLYRSAPLWSLFLIYWLAAITSNHNVGLRHILPTYPPMYILAAGAIYWLRKPAYANEAAAETEPNHRVPSWRRRFAHPYLALVVLASAGLYMAESLSTWPNYLTYFNFLAGGPKHGYRHLVDSSLDWGQDLPALGEWLDRQGYHGVAKPSVYLSYFGTAQPTYYHVTGKLLPCAYEIPHAPEQMQPGIYCISATMLQGVYLRYPGVWNPVYEQEYQQLLQITRIAREQAPTPAARARLIAQNPALWDLVSKRLEAASFGRLCARLRKREPTTAINNSILIYKVTVDDIQTALFGPPPELGPIHVR